jgi:two-component system response regulator RegA
VVENSPAGTAIAIVFGVRQDSPVTFSFPGDNPLILVVDDSPTEMQLMCDALSVARFNSVTAASVAEAETALKQHPGIALIVMDWGLDRCGAEVVKTARELYPLIPILVVSGSVRDHRPDVFNEQIDAFLDRPLNNTVLINQVKQLLKRSQFIPPGLYPQSIEEILRLDDLKSRYVQHVLRLLDNNLSAAAEKLGVHRQTLSSTLKRAKQDETKTGTSSDRTVDTIEEALLNH